MQATFFLSIYLFPSVISRYLLHHIPASNLPTLPLSYDLVCSIDPSYVCMSNPFDIHLCCSCRPLSLLCVYSLLSHPLCFPLLSGRCPSTCLCPSPPSSPISFLLARIGQHVDPIDSSTHRHGCYCDRVYLATTSRFIGMSPKTKGSSSPHLYPGNTEAIPQLLLDSPDRTFLPLQNQEQGSMCILEASSGPALCSSDHALTLYRRRTCNATSFTLSPAKSFRVPYQCPRPRLL